MSMSMSKCMGVEGEAVRLDEIILDCVVSEL